MGRWWVSFWVLGLLLLCVRSSGLTADGALLLAFKSSVLGDPLSVLRTWNHDDPTPCSWGGVTCGSRRRVAALALPSSGLLGTIPASLGLVRHLRILDLSNNSLHGPLPASLFNAPELRSLDLSRNSISGELPAVGALRNLVSLNLSDNAFAGNIPGNLTALPALAVISLRNNRLSGGLPSRIGAVRVFDMSSNLINGSLPSGIGGGGFRYFNVSHNRLSGEIPPGFAARVTTDTAMDLSHNFFSGQIPNPRTQPEALSPGAIAAFPSSTPEAPSNGFRRRQGRAWVRRPVTIVGIVAGDIAGITLLALTFWCIFHKKREVPCNPTAEANEKQRQKPNGIIHGSTSLPEMRSFSARSCLPKRVEEDEDSGGSETESSEKQGKQGGCLVTVDGGELELESLLRASAYMLGATGSSIMYRVVLENGAALAVRRIGETAALEKMKDFETQVRAVAKLVHPNLVKVRGFYWSLDDKLVIYEYVPNGSLADVRYRKMGSSSSSLSSSSPCHLPWGARLRIAKGVARGLAYLHEKKHVHSNLKPSNILLGSGLEPKIGDLGLDRLVSGDAAHRMGGWSARNFGSKRSTASRDGFPEVASPGPSPSPSSIGCASPYQAPESLRSLKPTPKWDVYSFGVVLMELLTGRSMSPEEAEAMVGQTEAAAAESPGDDGAVGKSRVRRAADVAIRAEVEGEEDALLACLKLGVSCVSPTPQRRPSMKEAVQLLDQIPLSPYPLLVLGHAD